MKFTKLYFVLLLSLTAQQTLAAGDAAAGKALYGTCVACHGANGEGNISLNSPAIGGQDAGYIERQLLNFKSGKRGADASDTYGMQMRGMASTLADASAVANVAAYIAGMPAGVAAAVEYDQRNGENQYNAACGACHGGKGEGNVALNAPRLAGLDAVYLKRQYQNFASGLRGSAADDRYGKQMQLMATMLASDKDLDDVIGFLLDQ